LSAANAGWSPKCAVSIGRQHADERTAARELHFERQALAFVDAVRTRVAERLAQPFARQVLLEARVSGFVDGAHQALREVIFAVTRREPHVLGHAAAKGMRALVEPAAREIETQFLHHREIEGTLRGNRKRAGRRDHAFGELLRFDARYQVRQPLIDVGKQAIDVGGAHARLVTVHQRVVAREARVGGEQARFFARKAHHFTKVDEKAAPVVGRPLTAPRMLAARAGKRPGLDQRFRQRIRVAPVAPHFAQIGALDISQRFLLRSLQQFRESRFGARAMDQRVQFRFGRCARRVALGRHHRVAVPADDGRQMAEAIKPQPHPAKLSVTRGESHCRAARRRNDIFIPAVLVGESRLLKPA
jgi:hypothetical protein